MDFQSSDEKDEEMPRSSSRTSIVPQSVPTVFKWENGGSIVYLSGSFNDWNSRIPMHGRYRHLIEIYYIIPYTLRIYYTSHIIYNYALLHVKEYIIIGLLSILLTSL